MAKASNSISSTESIDSYLSVMRIESLLAQPQTSVRRRFRDREPCPWPHWLLAQGNGPGYCLAQGGKPAAIGHTRSVMADEPFVKCRTSVLGVPAFLGYDNANPQRKQVRIRRIGCVARGCRGGGPSVPSCQK